MTEPQSRDRDDTRSGAPRGGQAQPPATPRWVKISGVVLVLAVLAVLAKAVVGGGLGGHGPGMHAGLGGLTSATSASSPVLVAARDLPRR